MEQSTKLAIENNWFDYDSLRNSLQFSCFIVIPLAALIIILFIGTEGFHRSYHFKMEIIGILFGLAVFLPFFFYIFKKTESYEKGFVHKSFRGKFRSQLMKYIETHFMDDPEAKSFKSPTKNYDVVGLYVTTDNQLKIQVQSFYNPPFTKEREIVVRVGPITKENYEKAQQILKSIDHSWGSQGNPAKS